MYLPVISYAVEVRKLYFLLKYALYRHIMLCCLVKVYLKYNTLPFGHILKMRAIGSSIISLQSYEATYFHFPNEFQTNLRYEAWENVFSNNDNDTNINFNNFFKYFP